MILIDREAPEILSSDFIGRMLTSLDEVIHVRLAQNDYIRSDCEK